MAIKLPPVSLQLNLGFFMQALMEEKNWIKMVSKLEEAKQILLRKQAQEIV